MVSFFLILFRFANSGLFPSYSSLQIIRVVCPTQGTRRIEVTEHESMSKFRTKVKSRQIESLQAAIYVSFLLFKDPRSFQLSGRSLEDHEEPEWKWRAAGGPFSLLLAFEVS